MKGAPVNGEVSWCVQGLVCGVCTAWVCWRDVTMTGNGDQPGYSGSAQGDRLRPALLLPEAWEPEKRDGALIACLPAWWVDRLAGCLDGCLLGELFPYCSSVCYYFTGST